MHSRAKLKEEDPPVIQKPKIIAPKNPNLNQNNRGIAQIKISRPVQKRDSRLLAPVSKQRGLLVKA